MKMFEERGEGGSGEGSENISDIIEIFIKKII